MATVYIAGPMTGYEHYNAAAFQTAATDWRAEGWQVVTPFECNSRVWQRIYGRDFDPATDHCDYGDPVLSLMLREDVRALASADAAAFLPGWRKSKGASFEFQVASMLGLELYDAATFAALPGESVLEEAVRLTGGERNASYGDPADDYLATVTAFNAVTRRTDALALTPSEGALFMCCVKLSREGHAPKRDNRTDLAGYAWVLDRCRQREG